MDSTELCKRTTRTTCAIAALALACGATLASLYLSIGMGLKACPLCFYQRTFMMAIAAVLGIGLFVDRSQGRLLLTTCLPLALAGWSVAAFHQSLVTRGALECPPGLLGLGEAPLQSLAAFSLVAVVIGIGVGKQVVALASGVALGLVLAWACVASSPPFPPPPSEPYEQPPEICRPPFSSE